MNTLFTTSSVRNTYPYRLYEILPGMLTWGTFVAAIVASWFVPVAASFFIIAFDFYWLLKSFFFVGHLRQAYQVMRENIKTDWMARVRTVRGWEDIYHLVILPAYHEPYETLKASLDAIAKSNWPKEKMIMVLAPEARGGAEDLAIAQRLAQEYGNLFFEFLITQHPPNLPGEITGKGSNETWAGREAQKVIDRRGIPYDRVIVSSLDSDTQVYPEYFALVAYRYLTEPDPLYASYQPIPIYNNNIWDAPFFSRVIAFSGTFWQMMQQIRPEQLITFSSHSMAFKSLVEMNFWDTDVVSEDSQIFWKALLWSDGKWRVVPLNYPVSMDANVGRNFWITAKNMYKQQRRWAFGAENVAYMMYGFYRNNKISFSKKWYFIYKQCEGFWSWSTNAIMILLLGWLPIILGGPNFNVSVLSYNLPRVTSFIMRLTMVGLIASAITSLFLLPPRPAHRPKWFTAWLMLEWLTLPVTVIFFGSFPAIEAQTRLMIGKPLGFWPTPKVKK